MIKFNLLNYVDTKTGQALFNTFREMSGITLAFALQRTLQDDDDYSNEFCKNCVRGTKEGNSLCKKAFAEYAKAISTSSDDEPIIFNCHAGLTDIVAPIKVNGQIATFLVLGQILLHKHNEKKARVYARKLGADEDKYVEEYKKVKYVTKNELKQLLIFLKTLANFITGVATEYYKIYQKSNRDILTLSLMEGINGSFNLSDTLAIASKELCNLFNISSAKVFEFNKVKNTFTTLTTYKQKKSVPDLTLKYNSETYLSSIMNFWCSNIEEEAGNRLIEFYDMTKDSSKLSKKIRDLYVDAGIYHVTGIKLKATKDSYIILALLDSKPGRTWNEDDKKFLNLIAKNISLAVKQNYLTESLSFETKSSRAIYNSFDFPIYYKDNKGRFVNLNESFCKYLGITEPATFIGKTTEEIFGENTYKVITDAEKFVMSSKQTITLDRIQDKNMNTIFDAKINPVCDGENLLGVFVHLSNIEKHKPESKDVVANKQVKPVIKVAKTVKTEKQNTKEKTPKTKKTVKSKSATKVEKDVYTSKKSGRIYKKK